MLGHIGDREFELVGIGGFGEAGFDQGAGLFEGVRGEGFGLAEDGHVLIGGQGGGVGFTGGAPGIGDGARLGGFHGAGVGFGGLNADEVARAEHELGGGDAGGHGLFRPEWNSWMASGSVGGASSGTPVACATPPRKVVR